MKKIKKRIKAIVTRTPEELAKVLGLDESAAIEWKVRREVTIRIKEVFDAKSLTMTDLAKRAETSLARISRILKGDTSDISLDVLFRVLGSLGQKVELKFQKVS